MVFLPEDCSKPGILFITCCRWEIKAGFCKTPHLAGRCCRTGRPSILICLSSGNFMLPNKIRSKFLVQCSFNLLLEQQAPYTTDASEVSRWPQGVTYSFDSDDEARKQAIVVYVQLASGHCNPSAAVPPVPPLARWTRTCPSGQRLSA